MEVTVHEEMTVHERFMLEALKEANKARAQGEVPVGAVIVYQGEIVARAFNQVETLKDASAHAEMLALREASSKLGRWRLSDCSLYVTLEPCAMCLAAFRLARISNIVFGASDSRFGAVCKSMQLAQDETWGPVPEFTAGVLREECSEGLKSFFRNLRVENKEERPPSPVSV